MRSAANARGSRSVKSASLCAGVNHAGTTPLPIEKKKQKKKTSVNSRERFIVEHTNEKSHSQLELSCRTLNKYSKARNWAIVGFACSTTALEVTKDALFHGIQTKDVDSASAN